MNKVITWSGGVDEEKAVEDLLNDKWFIVESYSLKTKWMFVFHKCTDECTKKDHGPDCEE